MTSETLFPIPAAYIHIQSMPEAWDGQREVLSVERARAYAYQRLAQAPVIREYLNRYALPVESEMFHRYQHCLTDVRTAYALMEVCGDAEDNGESYFAARQELIQHQLALAKPDGDFFRLTRDVLRHEVRERFGVDIDRQHPILASWALTAVERFNPDQSPDPVERIHICLGGTGLPYRAYATMVMLDDVSEWHMDHPDNLYRHIAHTFHDTSSGRDAAGWSLHERDIALMGRIAQSCYGHLI